MTIAETRPSIAPGVTVCRRVVVLITQRIGPTPIRKKLDAASGKVGIQIVKTMTSAATSPISGQATLTPEQAQQFAAGDWYVNVHTQAHPAGEIRGQVVPPKS